MLCNDQLLWYTVTSTSEVISAEYHDGYHSSSVSGPSQMAKKKKDLISLTLFIHMQRDPVCARCLWKSLKCRLTVRLLWIRLQGATSANNCFKIAVISPDCPTKLAKRLVSRDPDNACESSSLHLSIGILHRAL